MQGKTLLEVKTNAKGHLSRPSDPYYFWMVKVEASHPLAITSNSEVVTNDEDASAVSANYYGILQKIIEYKFGGAKELKVMFF
jgi:hypothetical protein